MPTVSDILIKFVSEPEKITDVVVGDGEEVYFQYGNHFFSIIARNKPNQQYGKYSFYVYPEWSGNSSQLAEYSASASVQEQKLVAYHSSEVDDADINRMARLSKILEEKSLNVDQIFKDVLDT